MEFHIMPDYIPEKEPMESQYDSLKGRRVLVCEDHPINIKIACRLLEKKGVICETAENGKIGVEMFNCSPENYYDAVLMDISMPEMDGLEATRTIRSLDRKDCKTIGIIAMTANAFDDDVKACLKAGMNEHLSKPIEPEILYKTLARYMVENSSSK